MARRGRSADTQGGAAEEVVVSKRSLSKAELIERVVEQTGMSRRDVKRVVDNTISHISEELSQGNRVQLTGFGSFEVRQRSARTGVRPGTTERIDIPASAYPAFKPGKALKDSFRS